MKTEHSENPYWLSLEQWRKDPEFEKLVDKEFQSSPLSVDEEGGWGRREFMKLMGASLALSSFGCIRRPVQKIVPYSVHPPEVIIGVANHYASAWVDNSEVFSLLMRTREGRPIKVEGNPSDPRNEGAASARAQAHILSLYDPDRLTGPKRNLFNDTKTNKDEVSTGWDVADAKIIEQLKKGSVALVTGDLSSPATRELTTAFVQVTAGRHYFYNPLSLRSLLDAQEMSYGERIIPEYNFDKAKRVVSVQCDFLGTYLTPTAFNRAFSKAKKPEEGMTRLTVFESLMSLTGTNADKRYRISVSDSLRVLQTLGVFIAQKAGLTRPPEWVSVSDQDLSLPQNTLASLADDLWAHRGESLIIFGGINAEGPISLASHLVVNFLNSALGNEGKTVVSGGRSSEWKGRGDSRELLNLVADLESGKIKTIVFHKVNPLYDFPERERLKEALKKAEMVITTSSWMDETAAESHYVLPDHHSMENWDEHEIAQGQIVVQQPTIQPLYQTRAFQDSLLKWIKELAPSRLPEANDWYAFFRGVWQKRAQAARFGGSFEEFWVELLQKGVYSTGAIAAASARTFRANSLQKSFVSKDAKAVGTELVLYTKTALRDGSLANVAWLQELPDPVTKICWDNYACVSPDFAEERKLKQGQVIVLKSLSGRSVKVPIHIQPGQASDVIGVSLGYGRERAGKVGNKIGVNAFDLAVWQGDVMNYSGLPVEYQSTTQIYPLANPQGHHSMEGRAIVIEAGLNDYLKKPDSGIHHHHITTIWPEHEYKGHRWGMGIDLNVCTGCSACVIACQAENNVPTVGKRYVIEGREMHWLRIDRYYKGDPSDPEVVHQPMLCQHCGNAPCETVCPVAATVHNPEGLNDMVYNRCVGTRYCSNNCPYKVRRFNWFNHQNANRNPYATSQAPLNKVLNPRVTVRSRGVMEKCTFCVQRIHEKKNEARDEKRDLRDGEIKTACEQTCPTNAIVFGDINDPNSRVSQWFKEKRAYSVLEEWNTRPSIRYLTRIRNDGKEASEDHDGHHSQNKKGLDEADGGHHS